MGRLRPRRPRAPRPPGSDATEPWLVPGALVPEPSSAHGAVDPWLHLLKGIREVSFLFKVQLGFQERNWGELGRDRAGHGADSRTSGRRKICPPLLGNRDVSERAYRTLTPTEQHPAVTAGCHASFLPGGHGWPGLESPHRQPSRCASPATCLVTSWCFGQPRCRGWGRGGR